MKKLLLLISLLLATNAWPSIPDDIHEKCKDVKDYVGCIQVFTDMVLLDTHKVEVFDDESYLPIFKVPPIYPRRAQVRGIEGCVMLEFTVTKVGAVRDPIVVWSQPSGIFDRSAMRAAMKFKYKPQIRDGEAIEVSGVLNQFTFIIDTPEKLGGYIPTGCEWY